MPNLLTIFQGYFFNNSTGKLTYDLLQKFWQRVFNKDLEALYLDAFERAIADQNGRIHQYGLNRVGLWRLLQSEFSQEEKSQLLDDLDETEFIQQLAQSLGNRQLLRLEGQNLPPGQYQRVARRFIAQVKHLFRQAVSAHEAAFQKILLTELQEDSTRLTYLQDHLTRRFDLTINLSAEKPVTTKQAASIYVRSNSRRTSLQRQLAQYYSNLNKLREQAAIYGAGETPLYLLNKIESEERRIEQAEAALEALDEVVDKAIDHEPVELASSSLNLPAELLEELAKDNVVLFCGEGISTIDGGLPTYRQLAQILAEDAHLEEVGNMSLPEVAQRYELEMGYHRLLTVLTDLIKDQQPYHPLITHQLIAALPFKRIITTNWDELLEKALDEINQPFIKVVNDHNIPFIDERKRLLIKLRGSIERIDSVVITDDDYDRHENLHKVKGLIADYFAQKTILFLGYGLADRDFKQMYGQVARHLQQLKRRAYAAQQTPDPFEKKYWQQKNVVFIDAGVVEFLQALQAQLGPA